jgi:hypothetical protein
MFFKGQISALSNEVSKLGVGSVQPLYDQNQTLLGHGVIYEAPAERELLALCSERYLMLQNQEIVNIVVENFGSSDKVIMKEHSGTMSLSIFTEEEFRNGFSAGLQVNNSMDGRVKYTITPAILKLVCTNGMVETAAASRHRILHIEKNRPLLPNIIDLFKTELNSFLDQYESLEQRIDETKLRAYLTKFGKKRMEKFVLEEVMPTNVQEVYDAITDFASNHNNYNWELIQQASALIYNPNLISA